ncbi:hypothetical protein ANN_09680 [Periplaneta americana]|uniref:Uncharacterized protein n=1 Tax=Periplaneta americana TaxID=6978 RepID=A0ABQ8TLZ0_PERAM|nr:hypothetical protein ANN_09680 [Periplaneta americana]
MSHVAHAQHRICENVRILFPNVDGLVYNGKQVFVKSCVVNCSKTGLNLSSDTNKGPLMRQLSQEIMGQGGHTLHVTDIAGKAWRALHFVMRVLRKGSDKSKEIAYTSLVRPVMEYGAACWNPYRLEHIKTLEKIQKRALKYCRKNSPLQWDTLTDRRTRIRLCALFKTYRGEPAWREIKNRLQPPNYSSRNDHSYKLRERRQRMDTGKFSFLNRTIRDWNALPADLLKALPTNKNIAFHGGSVIVWAGITLAARTVVIFGKGVSLTAHCYIFAKHVLSFRPYVCDDFVLMQDSTHPHVARCVLQYLNDFGIQFTQWPARSPDLISIEQMWDSVGSNIRNHAAEVSLATWTGMFFQHDGAPVHFRRQVMSSTVTVTRGYICCTTFLLQLQKLRVVFTHKPEVERYTLLFVLCNPSAAKVTTGGCESVHTQGTTFAATV